MKALVIYFSRAGENYFRGDIRSIDKGNTEIVAEFIKEVVDADLFKVERKADYPNDYKACIKESQEEQRRGARPELKEYLSDVSSYDVIFVGSPIFWGTMPQPMFTQLEKLDLSNKTIMPFTTHEGSALGEVIEDLRAIAPNANIRRGLAIHGSEVAGSKARVEAWIKENL